MTTIAPSTSELAILRKYAGGAGLNEIGEALGVPHKQVVAVVESVGFTRTRAVDQIRQYETNLQRRQVPKEATVHVAEPPQVDVEPQPDTIEQRLLRAEAMPRLKTRALRIRAMLADLGRDLESAAQVVEAERKVERLRAELAAATEALREATRPAAKKPAADAPPTSPDPVDVRKWAAANGVDCNPQGRVRRSVVDQYVAAQRVAA